MGACYEEAMEVIRQSLKKQPLWISVNEPTDGAGRAVGNVLTEKLDSSSYDNPYVFNTSFLERTDLNTIAHLVNDSLCIIDPNFNSTLAKIFLTDAAKYIEESCSGNHEESWPGAWRE